MTVDPATRPAAAPIGREVDRRVDPIVAAVLACPLVAGLHGGRDGQVVTYLPGRRVTGIRITVDEVAIHVVACYPAAMDQVARQVRSAVAPFTAGLGVDVTIEDLAIPSEPSSGPQPDIPAHRLDHRQGVLIVNGTLIGLLVGLALGFAGAFGGFVAFIIVLFLGAVGLLVGRVLDGQLDLSSLTGSGRDRIR